MNQHARAPNPPPPPQETRLRQALLGLSHAITELIYLSTDDRSVLTPHLDLLRTKRHQLSRIIDDVGRFTGQPGEAGLTDPTVRRRPPPQ